MNQVAEKRLLAIVDGSLAGVIFLLPLLLGGRHPWGHLALAILAVTMAMAWAGRGWLARDVAWHPTQAAPLLLAGAALVLLQCIPLPAALLAWLAPGNAAMLSLWKPNGLGSWQYVSMTPADTQAALAMFLAYGLIFLVTAQRIRAIEDVERLLRWCGLSALCMATFGLIQFFAGNGKFLWFYDDPYGLAYDSVKGSFTNRNHFAHFLALGIGPLIWWFQNQGVGNHSSSKQRLPTPFIGLALGIVAFAGLLSLSRGGITVMVLAATISAAVCYRTSAIGSRIGSRILTAMAGCGLLIGIALSVFGYDRVADRLDSVSSGSIEKMDHGAGRRRIWAAAIQSTANHLLIGSGAGSFAEVYPVHADVGAREGLEFTHAESSPLQAGLETGLTGLVLLLAGMALCGRWCLGGLARSNPSRVRLCAAAITASLAASVVHALADFVWYVPACTALVSIFAACALRTAQLAANLPSPGTDRRLDGRGAGGKGAVPKALPLTLSQRERGHGRRRFAYAAACVALLPVGGWMTATLFPSAAAAPAWNRYRLALNRLEADTESAGYRQTHDDGRAAEAEQKLIADLEQVVAWQPRHARAHLELAESHLRLFAQLQATADNPMSLVNVRDAVLQSHFPSRAAMHEWLDRAVGQHGDHLKRALQHTRKALTLCPLLGRGYVYLAELCFLDENAQVATSACIEQALKVRPFDGTVLRGAASEAYLAGDQAKWLDYTRRAFHSGRRQQRQLIADLLSNTASTDIPHIVDFVVQELQPDLDGLRFLHTACAARCPAEQLSPLVSYRAQRTAAEAATLDRALAAKTWLEAYQLYRQLNNNAESLRCAREAVDCDPGNYELRYQLATCLLRQRRFADAELQWRWCLQRAPNNPTVEANLRDAIKGRLEDERRATTGGNRLR